jgi:flagellar biosynthesis protein FlhA
VFRNLIQEGVGVRDTQAVLEALSEYAPRTRDPDVLTEFVRQRLARHVTRRFASAENVLQYIGFAPDSEDLIVRSLQSHEGAAPTLSMDPEALRRLIQRAREAMESHTGATPPVILAPPLARGALRRILERVLPRVAVLSSAELAPTVKLERIGTIDLRSDPGGKKTSSDRPSVR